MPHTKPLTCCWLLSKLGVFPAVYCGAKTGYRTVKDDDGNLARDYRHFCDAHQKIADAMPEDD